MKKQGYIKPAMQVIQMQSGNLLTISGGSTGIEFGGGGSGSARSREFDVDEY